MIDLTRLTSAPWFADESYLVQGDDKHGTQLAKFESIHREDDCAFAALARNAFAIMMERGWSVDNINPDGKWRLSQTSLHKIKVTELGREFWDWYRYSPSYDPFAALVSADKWYRENVENG